MTVIIKRKRSDSPADDQQHNQEIPDFGGISLATMANYLVLLSQGAHHHQQQQQQQQHTSPFVCFDSSSSATTSSSDHHLPTTTTQQRVFECKTCNRQFPSFQALGGHRASHKRPKLQHHDANGNGNGTTTHSSDSTPIPHKPKSHECSICGLEFPIGQALGGHMRRHRAIYTDHGGSTAPILFPPPPQQPHPTSHLSLSLKLATTSPHHIPVKKPSTSIASEMLRRTTSGRATLCLDLNLTPFENGVDQLGKLAPIYG